MTERLVTRMENTKRILMALDTHPSILVTGGAGFVGSHICEQLLRNGKKVIVVDALNSETSSQDEKIDTLSYLSRLSNSVMSSQFSSYVCNILDEQQLCQILEYEKPTACIHAASLVMDRRSVYAATEFIMQNVYGTQCLLNAITTTKTVKHLVFISSRSVLGETIESNTITTEIDLPQPINPYGASKAATEAFCHAFHKNTSLPVSICRMQPMYGPRCRPDMMPRRLVERISTGKKIEIFGTGNAVRDWLYITDAVDGILAVLQTPMQYTIFNFGTGVGTTVNELISLAEKVIGKQANVVYVNKRAGDARFGGICNYSKAKYFLNWEPSIDLNQGFSKMFRQMIEYSVFDC